MDQLSHTDSNGKARMVDVGSKPDMFRTAFAMGFIELQTSTIELIRANIVKKGDVLTVAEIAGIMAAKKTSELIPLCHQLQLSKVEVQVTIETTGISVVSTTKCIGQTGVEMEALTAVSIALLTIYDMCKAVDKTMKITDIRLIQKEKTDLNPTI